MNSAIPVCLATILPEQHIEPVGYCHNSSQQGVTEVERRKHCVWWAHLVESESDVGRHRNVEKIPATLLDPAILQ